MNRPKAEIASLLSLLDDENEEVAVNAMAELLYREEELGYALAELQEGENPLARRRAHQLQAAITLRRRRREFLRRLDAPRINLAEGLIEVHLQWYDNDSRPGLIKLWNDFQLEAHRCPLQTLENLSYFMRKSGFSAMPETTLHPEYYCIGPVIENHIGSAALLCGILLEIADPSLPLKMVRVLGDFGLYDGDGMKQRRDRCGCDRRGGKPDVERKYGGFDTEAEKCEKIRNKPRCIERVVINPA